MISFFFSGSCLSSLEKSLSSLYKISFGMPPPYAIHLGRPCNHCEVKRNLKYSEFAFAQFWKLQRSLTPFNTTFSPSLMQSLDLPVEVVASALSHISHLVKSLSMILNLKLPHPLLPFDTFESAIIRSHGNLS
jgi:hypothetical protein